MKARVKKVVLIYLCIIIVGIGYAIFVTTTGIGIPCVIYKRFHVKCPGCGISHLFLHLMRLEWKEAFLSNIGLVLISPLLLVILVKQTVTYVKTGQKTMNQGMNRLMIGCIIYLVIWAIVRNIIHL